MIEWWTAIAAISIGVPIASIMRMHPILSGMFCMGLNLLFTHWGR